jgi:general secretion pathway protein C
MNRVASSLFAARTLTVLIWACAVGSAVVWGLKWTRPLAVPVAIPASERAIAASDAQRMGRLLGAGPSPAVAAVAQPAETARFVLQGVVVSARGGGAALIATDGKPARPYRVGQPVTDGTWLMGVEPRAAMLGHTVRGPEKARLTLSPPPSTSTSTAAR